MEDLLPIGSVVLLNGANKKLMIYGRKQLQADTGKLWDYVGCLYPEGNITAEYTYMFNHTDIKEVFFVGYKNEEEEKLQILLRALKQKTEEDEKDNNKNA
jgi:hypothetical protein